jgi:hypothetical protein
MFIHQNNYTAAPLEIFNILNKIDDWSAVLEIIPPRASISLTKVPLPIPPIDG